MSSILKVSEIQDPTNGNTALDIDSSGRVNHPQNPRLHVQGNNGNYVSTSPIPFGNKIIDTAGGWNSSTNTYTVQLAGTYLVMLDLGIVLTNGTNAVAYPRIVYNGSNDAYTYIQSSTGAQYHGATLHRMFDCSLNDTFQITFNNTNGTYYNGANECGLSIYMIG